MLAKATDEYLCLSLTKKCRVFEIDSFFKKENITSTYLSFIVTVDVPASEKSGDNRANKGTRLQESETCKKFTHRS